MQVVKKVLPNSYFTRRKSHTKCTSSFDTLLVNWT